MTGATGRVWLLAASMILGAGGSGAHAAQLRVVSMVHGPVVHLADLFADLGAGQDCVLGPAPLPGGQLVIGNAQLVAIAQQFGVDWVPSSQSLSMSLSRPGQAIDREAVESLLAAALRDRDIALAADETADVDVVPAAQIDVGARMSIVDLVARPGEARFGATLVAASGGEEIGRYPIAGTIRRLTSVEVPAHDIPAGEIITPSDLKPRRIAVVPGMNVARSAGEIVGLVSGEKLPAGAPIEGDRLRKPVLIAKNAAVLMRLDADGIDVTAAGQAIEPGGYGDHIRVMNMSSHAVLLAAVTGPGQVAIEPGAPLLTVAGQEARGARNGPNSAVRPAGWP